MAHDETASTSKWAKDEHPVGGQQQLKKKLPQVKENSHLSPPTPFKSDTSSARVLVRLYT